MKSRDVGAFPTRYPRFISPHSCAFTRHWTPSVPADPAVSPTPSQASGSSHLPRAVEAPSPLQRCPAKPWSPWSPWPVPLSPEQPHSTAQGAPQLLGKGQSWSLDPGAVNPGQHSTAEPPGFATSLLLHPTGSVWSQGLSQAVSANHGLLLTLSPHPAPHLPQQRSWSQNFPASRCPHSLDYLFWLKPPQICSPPHQV